MINEIGFATWTLGDTPLIDTLPRLAKMGYTGFELIGDSARPPASEVLTLSQEYGLSILSVVAVNEIDLAHPLHSMRQESMEMVRSLLEYCVEIGCSRLILREKPGRMRPIVGRLKEWNVLQQSWRALAHSAMSVGVQICFLPVNRYEGFLINTASEALSLLERSDPHSGVALSTYHMNVEERGFRSTFEEVGRRLGLLYAVESNRRALGDGHIDWLEVCLSLDAIGYEGPVVIECQALGADPLLPVGRSPAWVDEVFDLAEQSIQNLRVALAACRRS